MLYIPVQFLKQCHAVPEHHFYCQSPCTCKARNSLQLSNVLAPSGLFSLPADLGIHLHSLQQAKAVGPQVVLMRDTNRVWTSVSSPAAWHPLVILFVHSYTGAPCGLLVRFSLYLSNFLDSYVKL